MDEQERKAEIRRCTIITLVMIAAGMVILAAQGGLAPGTVPAGASGRTGAAAGTAPSRTGLPATHAGGAHPLPRAAAGHRPQPGVRLAVRPVPVGAAVRDR